MNASRTPSICLAVYIFIFPALLFEATADYTKLSWLYIDFTMRGRQTHYACLGEPNIEVQLRKSDNSLAHSLRGSAPSE